MLNIEPARIHGINGTWLWYIISFPRLVRLLKFSWVPRTLLLTRIKEFQILRIYDKQIFFFFYQARTVLLLWRRCDFRDTGKTLTVPFLRLADNKKNFSEETDYFILQLEINSLKCKTPMGKIHVQVLALGKAVVPTTSNVSYHEWQHVEMSHLPLLPATRDPCTSYLLLFSTHTTSKPHCQTTLQDV